MTRDPDTVLLSPVVIDPAVVAVAAPAARRSARRFVGRHDVDFARPDHAGVDADEKDENE